MSASEDTIARLIRNRQASVSPVEVGNAAALDGAVVIDGNGIVRGIGCIFETKRIRTAGEGARTRAALFASKDGVALKISQDGEISMFSNRKNKATIFSPVG